MKDFVMFNPNGNSFPQDENVSINGVCCVADLQQIYNKNDISKAQMVPIQV